MYTVCLKVSIVHSIVKTNTSGSFMIKHVVYGLSSNEINEDKSVERIPNRKHTRDIDMDCMKYSIIDFQSVEVNSNRWKFAMEILFYP